jgi:hypothetical protein
MASMDLCSSGHDEVCYNARRCPVCEEQDKVVSLEKEIELLKEQVEDLESRL